MITINCDLCGVEIDPRNEPARVAGVLRDELVTGEPVELRLRLRFEAHVPGALDEEDFEPWGDPHFPAFRLCSPCELRAAFRAIAEAGVVVPEVRGEDGEVLHGCSWEPRTAEVDAGRGAYDVY